MPDVSQMIYVLMPRTRLKSKRTLKVIPESAYQLQVTLGSKEESNERCQIRPPEILIDVRPPAVIRHHREFSRP